MDRANEVINNLILVTESQGQQIAMLVQQQKMGVERSEMTKVRPPSERSTREERGAYVTSIKKHYTL